MGAFPQNGGSSGIDSIVILGTMTRAIDETSSSMKTVVLCVFVGVVACTLMVLRKDDPLGAWKAWALVGTASVGYLVSRSLANGGSGHRVD